MMMKQMQQDQDMHTLTNNRPFFSIIIPCYNSGKTIARALDSIVNQKLDYNDIQVVLADDCSTESYQDIVDTYKDKLFITQCKTEYNKCPGNTRQCGADHAIGEWITFMDHDDFLIEGSYKILKDHLPIIENQTVVLTGFLKKLADDSYVEMPINAGWTHGKFFNLDNFWKKYNLHYIKDMQSHEDVCLSTEMEFVRQAYGVELSQININTYVWVYSPNSLSNLKYTKMGKERVFIDAFLIDYINSTAGVAYQFYKETGKGKEFAITHMEKVLLYSYFYNEYARYKTPQYLIENCDYIRNFIIILQNEFNLTLQDIINFFSANDSEQYKTIWNVAKDQIEQFLFDFSFKEWYNWIKNKKYLKA